LQISEEAIGYSIRTDKSGSITGIGRYDGRSEFFQPDEDLHWTVKEEWDLANAAKTSLTYAMVTEKHLQSLKSIFTPSPSFSSRHIMFFSKWLA